MRQRVVGAYRLQLRDVVEIELPDLSDEKFVVSAKRDEPCDSLDKRDMQGAIVVIDDLAELGDDVLKGRLLLLTQPSTLGPLLATNRLYGGKIDAAEELADGPFAFIVPATIPSGDCLWCIPIRLCLKFEPGDL